MAVGGQISADLWVKHHQGLDHEELCDDAADGCSARKDLHMRCWYGEPLVVQRHWQRNSQGSHPDCLCDPAAQWCREDGKLDVLNDIKADKMIKIGGVRQQEMYEQVDRGSPRQSLGR